MNLNPNKNEGDSENPKQQKQNPFQKIASVWRMDQNKNDIQPAENTKTLDINNVPYDSKESSEMYNNFFDKKFPSTINYETLPEEWVNPDLRYDENFRARWTALDTIDYLIYNGNEVYHELENWYYDSDPSTIDGRKALNSQEQTKRQRYLNYQQNLRTRRLNEAMAKDIKKLEEKNRYCNNWKDSETSRIKAIYEQDKKILPGINDRARDYPFWLINDDYSNYDIVTPLCPQDNIGSSLSNVVVTKERDYQPNYKEKYKETQTHYENLRNECKAIQENLQYKENKVQECVSSFEELLVERNSLKSLLEKQRNLPPKIVEVEVKPKMVPTEAPVKKIDDSCKASQEFYKEYKDLCDSGTIRALQDFITAPLQLLRAESPVWRNSRPAAWIRHFCALLLFLIEFLVVAFCILQLNIFFQTFLFPIITYFIEFIKQLMELIPDKKNETRRKTKEKKKSKSRLNSLLNKKKEEKEKEARHLFGLRNRVSNFVNSSLGIRGGDLFHRRRVFQSPPIPLNSLEELHISLTTDIKLCFLACGFDVTRVQKYQKPVNLPKSGKNKTNRTIRILGILHYILSAESRKYSSSVSMPVVMAPSEPSESVYRPQYVDSFFGTTHTMDAIENIFDITDRKDPTESTFGTTDTFGTTGTFGTTERLQNKAQPDFVFEAGGKSWGLGFQSRQQEKFDFDGFEKEWLEPLGITTLGSLDSSSERNLGNSETEQTFVSPNKKSKMKNSRMKNSRMKNPRKPRVNNLQNLREQDRISGKLNKFGATKVSTDGNRVYTDGHRIWEIAEDVIIPAEHLPYFFTDENVSSFIKKPDSYENSEKVPVSKTLTSQRKAKKKSRVNTLQNLREQDRISGKLNSLTNVQNVPVSETPTSQRKAKKKSRVNTLQNLREQDRISGKLNSLTNVQDGSVSETPTSQRKT